MCACVWVYVCVCVCICVRGVGICVHECLRMSMCGRDGSGGKAVGGLQVRSHPGRVEVSLSKTPNPQLLLMSWLVPYMAANACVCVCVCVCV